MIKKINKSLVFFLKNLKNLCLALFHGKIHWDVEDSDNNEIHCDTKIYGPYFVKYVSLGKGSYIAPNSIISHTEIGKFCSIGPNFFCGWGIHPITGISTSPVFYSTKKQAGFSYCTEDKITERKTIKIGNDVFIGANVTILDGVTIGDGAVIGAGSVVSKDIPPYAIALGVPIKIVRYRFETNVIDRLLILKWWDWNDNDLKIIVEKFWKVEELVKDVDTSNI